MKSLGEVCCVLKKDCKASEIFFPFFFFREPHCAARKKKSDKEIAYPSPPAAPRWSQGPHRPEEQPIARGPRGNVPVTSLLVFPFFWRAK